MEGNEMDLNSICRLCMQQREDLIPIFHEEAGRGLELPLSNMIMNFAPNIKVEVDDDLPSQICEMCLQQLNISYDFKRQCEHSDAVLRKHLQNLKNIRIFKQERPDGQDAQTPEDTNGVDWSLIPVKTELRDDDYEDNGAQEDLNHSQYSSDLQSQQFETQRFLSGENHNMGAVTNAEHLLATAYLSGFKFDNSNLDARKRFACVECDGRGTESAENGIPKTKSSIEVDSDDEDFSIGGSKDYNPGLDKYAYSSKMDGYDGARKSTEEKEKETCKVSATTFEKNSLLRSKKERGQLQQDSNIGNCMKGRYYVGIQEDELGKVRHNVPRIETAIKAQCMCKRAALNRGRNCNDITEQQREAIFNHFWNEMSLSDRKAFIRSHVDSVPVKRHRNQADISRRSNTLCYSFVVEGKRLSVCKTMFLNTLSLGEWTVRKWTKKEISTGTSELFSECFR